MKQEILQTKSRKLKKRSWRKRTIAQINLSSCLNYNLFTYFIRKEKIQLSRKLIASIFVNEAGTSFSFKKWMLQFYRV
uniref:ribosomal protein L20 n=1 Tax=Grateloupia turuturu TaxID=118375 RepID=UPI00279E2C85|nr:ribosomal protein L20 [Grateloupia turuturu]YP_010986440.1 ribosomal protein L20 [Pachymeniopsis lanceolata]WIM51248.1 ribosomal protein L20 [Grateloupia turuturu]WOL37408.1 ribosomal protein L20 [Pachymeniopsis lanceolata]